MVTPVKQQDQNCCVLACIESLSIDKQRHRTQSQIIDDFPAWCHKGEFQVYANGQKVKKDGQVDPLALFHILREMRLASSCEVGTGRAFVDARKTRINDGIFFLTTTHQNGSYGSFHCVRLENPRIDDFAVMEPSQSYQPAYRLIRWDSAEFLGSVAVVLVP
jgi:hypothetical protein